MRDLSPLALVRRGEGTGVRGISERPHRARLPMFSNDGFAAKAKQVAG
ncbi:MAG: hypothetical protein JWN70_4309 [Planctomycetaceae bacterium]|nr:hypothetical protein [Planctomycetaceae bacterium]